MTKLPCRGCEKRLREAEEEARRREEQQKRREEEARRKEERLVAQVKELTAALQRTRDKVKQRDQVIRQIRSDPSLLVPHWSN
jgi:predicted  nucleic acid-binding Zn-ribbon protein